MVGKNTLTSPVYTPETGKNECGVTRMRARKLGFAALSMLASLLQSQDRQVHFRYKVTQEYQQIEEKMG